MSVSGNVARLLDRLEGVKSTGTGRWIAKCPAHPDRSPSLAIREAEVGRVLIHDFGGCDTGDVLAAIGLGLSDLFDKHVEHRVTPSQINVPARELLILLDHEITVAALILDEVTKRRAITGTQMQRLVQAARRHRPCPRYLRPGKGFSCSLTTTT